MNGSRNSSQSLPAWCRLSLKGLLLIQGVSLMGVLGLSDGNMVWAQSDPSLDASVAEPASSSPATLESTAPVDTAPTAPEDFPPVYAPIDAAPEVAPAPAESTAASDPTPASESYIDSTSYSVGATQRSGDMAEQQSSASAPGLRPSAPTSVSIGPVSVGDYGLGIGSTTPSVRDYYKRTVRPPGLLGNGNISLIFPLSIPAPITSAFGWRVHPVTGDSRFHSGTDLGAPMGTPVLAAYAGQVALSDFLGGYGLAVVLDHNKGTQQTLYGHLSEVFVKPGEWVNQGMVIGRVGSTGMSTGPHLHFEFRQQTPAGWVTLDAGTQLEYALAQFVRAVQTGQISPGSGMLVGSLTGQPGVPSLWVGELKLSAALQPNGKRRLE